MIKRQVFNISVDDIENYDEYFFRQIQMRGDKVKKKFSIQFEDTKAKAYGAARMQALVQSFPLDKIEGESVYIAGHEFQSKMLSEVFAKAEEIVMCAITVHGYDEAEAEVTDNVSVLFMDGWGTTLVTAAHDWVKDYIKEEAGKSNMYTTCAWEPGQINVDISLQKDFFEVMNPDEIEITLNDHMMMHPKKSITSLIGLGPDSEINEVRACDFCEHRETCPTAYS